MSGSCLRATLLSSVPASGGGLPPPRLCIGESSFRLSTMTDLTVAVSAETLSLATGLDAWILGIKKKVATAILQNLNASTDHLDRHIAVAGVDEIPGLFVACSFYQRDINLALTRAGLFMGAGKGTAAGTLVRTSDPKLINYQKLVAGHNLPGEVISDFVAAGGATGDTDLRLSDDERMFFDTFLHAPAVTACGKVFYLIAFSAQSTKDYRSVISHEVFHAHYALNPAYRAVVRKFWNDVVSAEDKVLITADVGRAYNVDVEQLVIDEFQAYLIQEKAELDLAKAFVARYQRVLREELKAVGITFA